MFRSNSKAYRQLRQQLVEDHKLEAIIYLPSGVFKPYSGVSTAILVFTKTNAGGTDNVWLYNMEADGYTLDDKRDPDEKNNDIPDIIERWANLGDESERERTEKSFLVPKQEIVDNESTAILVFTKTNAGGTDNVWLYNMEADGYTLDDKRDPDEKNNDIPDIIERWANLGDESERERTEKSFLVPRQEIVDNEYDFSFNKYTKTEYERIEYPPTSEILAELDELNAQFAAGLAELHKMLEGDL